MYGGVVVRVINRATIGLALLMTVGTSWGFFGGEGEPMYVEADKVDIDDAKGESLYRGNVEVNQGGIFIAGDKMTTYKNKQSSEIDKVVTVGKQARFTQKASATKKAMDAKADRIIFYLDKDLVLLIGKAQILQTGTEFYGARIEYNMKTQAVHAERGKSGKRVRMVLQPKKKAAQ
jgi:lipopolysaccharide export system protein LptA